MLDTTLNARIQSFLDKFDAALAAGDIDAAVEMFAPECYWRDLVAFTCNTKTMEGRGQVREMLSSCLARVKPRNWKIAEGERQPKPMALPNAGSRSRMAPRAATV